jgi:hypothetical protein
MYEYDKEDRNLHTSKSLYYDKKELDFIPGNLPNDMYKLENHTLGGGFNYKITPRQHAGMKADFIYGSINTFEEFWMRRVDPSNNYDRILTNTTKNRIEANTFIGTLFYQGQVSDRIRLSGDFTYNYYLNNMSNSYVQDNASNFHYFDEWNESKRQTVLNLDATYYQTEKMTLEAGYSNIRQQYASSSSQGRGFLDYRESRNKAFVYQSCYFSSKTGFKTGIALEQIHQQNGEKAHRYLRVLPYFTAYYRINKAFNIAAGYSTNQSYPSLYQISPMNIVIDTFLTQVGNQALKSAVRHQVYIELALFDKFKLTPQVTHIRDGVSEIYDVRAYKLYRTFANISFREYSLQASFDKMLGKHFHLKNSVRFYHGKAYHQETGNTLNGCTFHSEVAYYQPKSSLGVQLGYFRNMRKTILWQGYQMSEKDYWCVTVKKEFWDNRLSVVLSYMPPVRLGVRYDIVKEMNTSFYKEKTVQNLETYNQMLLIKAGLRLESGKMKNARR